jgi:hypothetical protein
LCVFSRIGFRTHNAATDQRYSEYIAELKKEERLFSGMMVNSGVISAGSMTGAAGRLRGIFN